MTWINPGMLGFLSLGAIPIIIYLINRQRYRRVPWAAMEFLLRAMKKHRRRLRLENLLLLLIRTAAVLLFVLAMARPSLDSGSLPVLTGDSGRSELFLVDRSYSMALQSTGRSSLRVAADSARDRLKSLSKGDRVGLIYGGGFPDTITPTPEVVTDTGSLLVLEQLEEAAIAYESLEVAPLLSVAADWVTTGPSRDTPWLIHLYSDLQKRDWVGGDGSTDPAIREALGRLDEANARVFVHPASTPRARNVSVSSVTCGTPLLAVDLPTTFQMTVENFGREAVAGLEAELWIDGEVQGSRRISVEPGASVSVSFPHVFRSVGSTRVKALVRSDDLEVDNERLAVFDVRESVEILVVDGSYDTKDNSSEADWLKAALAGDRVDETGVRLSPYLLRTITPDQFSGEVLDGIDVLILVDVPEFSEPEVERVEAFLSEGGGVLFFPGDRFRSANFRTRSWRGGEGWFPYEPDRVIVDRERRTYYHFQIVDVEHPSLSYLAETPEAGIADVAIHGYVRPVTAEGSKVLLSLDDPQETPALLEKRFGKGTTLALTIGAGRRWSNFPIPPAYLVFLYETLPYLATQDETSRNLAIGEPFQQVISAGDYAPRVLLVRPSGDGVPVVLEERDDRRSFDLSIDGQLVPGTYEIRFGGRGENESRSEWFAVNADPREGDLTALLPEDLIELYPDLLLVEKQDEIETIDDYGTGDLWMPIFWVVLGLLIAESALARFFGGRRARRLA